MAKNKPRSIEKPKMAIPPRAVSDEKIFDDINSLYESARMRPRFARFGEVEWQLEDIKRSIREIRRGHIAFMYREIQRAYGVAAYLRAAPARSASFCNSEARKVPSNIRPDKFDQNRLLWLVLGRVFGTGNEAQIRLVTETYECLAPLFERGVDPSAIAKKLRDAGGRKRLRKAHQKIATEQRLLAKIGQREKKSRKQAEKGQRLVAALAEFEVGLLDIWKRQKVI
jgi:hypothetical protein